MKTYLILSFLPFAVACNKTHNPVTSQTPIAPVNKVSSALNPSGASWQHIVGTVQLQEKCPVSPAPEDCLKITGGDDLNDDQVFYLPNSKHKLKALKNSQHVDLLARLETPAPDGNAVIGAVQSAEVMYK